MERNEHRLAFLDQAALQLMRATGRGQLMQCVWVYERPVDEEGLKRLHRNLFQSLGGRLIELSPLPFGRPRWVRPGGAPPPLRVADQPRPRSELMDWADELGTLPIDPINGPGWHVAVQPLDDGSTAVSIVASHVIGDGVGALMAVFEGVTGNVRDGGYERAGARPRREAMVADVKQAARDLPNALKIAAKAARMAREKRGDFARARTAAKNRPVDTTPVFVPSVAVFVDTAVWDAKAAELGGNTYSLVAAYAAKLGEHLGRRRPSDGAVTLSIAINLRESLDDDRALAMAFANASLDPTTLTTNLDEARTAVRVAREKAKAETDPTMEMMALVPWMPANAVKSVIDLMFAHSDDLPVSCSNLGDLPPELGRADGTDADYVFIRALDTAVTLGELERLHGQLVVVSGRINGRLSISVEAYQVGAENTKERLRALAAQTLEEFGITAEVY